MEGLVGDELHSRVALFQKHVTPHKSWRRQHSILVGMDQLTTTFINCYLSHDRYIFVYGWLKEYRIVKYFLFNYWTVFQSDFYTCISQKYFVNWKILKFLVKQGLLIKKIKLLDSMRLLNWDLNSKLPLDRVQIFWSNPKLTLPTRFSFC